MSPKTAPAKKSTATKHKIVKIGVAPTKILHVVAMRKAQLGLDLEKSLLSPLTGISGASTIRNGLAALKKQELITVEGGMVIATDEGMEAADLSAVDLANMPKSNSDYHDTIKTDRKFLPKEIAVFDAIADGRVYMKEEVRIATSFAKNSTWRNLLAGLKKKGILDYPGKDSIQLMHDMFPFEPRPE